MNVFKKIWNSLVYTFESDASFYARIRREDALQTPVNRGGVLLDTAAIVEAKVAPKTAKPAAKRTKKTA
jgi:hypothetical protein